MIRIPDLDDRRYLNEVGWFLYREKYGYNYHTGSFMEERLVWSKMLLEGFLECSGHEPHWLSDKTVVTIGCSCIGDLTT